MAIKLTPYEKETIIITSEGDDEYIFETFNKGLMRRLAAFGEKYPDCCHVKRVYPEGCISFCIQKGCLSFHLNAPISKERRNQAREQAKKNGLVGGNPSKTARIV